jgi:hypothetical protein
MPTTASPTRSSSPRTPSPSPAPCWPGTHNGGSRLDAGKVNSRRFVLDRADACERERGRPVNLIAVDHATNGDAQGATEALNAEH